MTDTAQATDEQMGFTVIFGILALVGALLMYFGALEGGLALSAGWGFAAAVLFGTAVVVAIHATE